jgi:hypothetical protein
MAEQSFPFENIDTTESQFSEWATNFQETGVQGSPTGTELGITVTGSDMNLTIAAGQAFIRGHYYINTSDLVLAVPSAGVNTRIDILVVELDPEANTIVTKIVSGEAVSADPVAPTLTQSATGIYQLPISTLTIPTSTVAITAGMLVDTRTFMGQRVGIWTTATRPSAPLDNQTFGYNSTEGYHEYWTGSTWASFVASSTGAFYSITEAGTYTVDLPAGFYDAETVGGKATVQGVLVDGQMGIREFASGITTLLTETFVEFVAFLSIGSNPVLGVAYGNGLYVAAGTSSRVHRSATTATGTWSEATVPLMNNYLFDIAFGAGKYVVCGDGKIGYSTDAITWTDVALPGGQRRQTIEFYDSLFITAGEGGLMSSSPDGVSWTSRSNAAPGYIWGLAYGDGLWIAMGESGWLATSPDGITWTDRTSSFGSTLIYDGDYGAGTYVIVGQGGKIATSPDGITWTQRTSVFGTTYIYSVAFGDGLFVAVAAAGKLAVSTDGITWTLKTSQFGSNNINSVVYSQDDEKFVAVGAGGGGSTSNGPEYLTSNLFLTPKSPIVTLP